MDVANWLHSLDLRQYEAAFLENAVTFDLLPSLTADDLKDLGVTAVGHRRRILNAVAELQTAVAAADAIAGSAAEERVFATAAERRQLSVMFCDVIDYTALSVRLDPEDLNAIIRNYQARVASIIARYGGFIADYLGDGVLIYFGWPDAHEANAERAVRAALAITETIGQTPVHLEPVRVRIGIATGLVVIGEPLGVGESRHPTAIGETPNLAARLQALAPPDGIVIDVATRRQIGGLFLSKDLGLVTLKGLPEPLSVWQVMSEADVESRFEALRADNMAPLIGREEELDLLLRRWRQAVRGDGQAVLLSGEPGIGKSRLIAALEERLDDEAHISLRYFSSPHHQDSALYPVIARWEHDLHFIRDETTTEKLRKLETALAKLQTSPEDIALIADLLSVPVDDRYPSVNLTPQLKKERTFEALLRSLVQRARRQPVLMVFEDAHWTDASTIDLLDRVVRMLSDLPILLLVSFRPEFRPSWTGLAFVNLITLRRLTHRQAIKLAEHVVVTDTLSPAILERIVKQTDGVPLFIEELTKTVLENVDRSDPQLRSVEVPQTLQASLVARLDKLPAAKQIAQIGAVVGRDFTHSLLAAAAKVSEAQLSAGIDALVDSGLAFRRGVGSQAVYTFKHALVRDAAYSTLLRSQRQDVHARIANALEAEFPVLVETQPELLAHHLAQAGLTGQAIEYWRRAGLRSIAKSAHTEAGAHFSTALDLLKQFPTGELRNARELDLTLNLAVPLIAVHGFGSQRVEDCAMQAL
ncbi:MAG: ATP-binding protein, partial [Rhodopila sp.]